MEQLLNSNISSVQNIFYNYIQKQGVFKDKNALTSSFIPSNIQHRENEIKQLSLMIAPMLKGFQTSNIFIYGKCGTGKTMSSRFVLNQLESASKEHIR